MSKKGIRNQPADEKNQLTNQNTPFIQKNYISPSESGLPDQHFADEHEATPFLTLNPSVQGISEYMVFMTNIRKNRFVWANMFEKMSRNDIKLMQHP